jgi:hypothetical protein
MINISSHWAAQPAGTPPHDKPREKSRKETRRGPRAARGRHLHALGPQQVQGPGETYLETSVQNFIWSFIEDCWVALGAEANLSMLVLKFYEGGDCCWA